MNFGSVYQNCKQSAYVWVSAVVLVMFGIVYLGGVIFLHILQMLRIVKKPNNYAFDCISE